MYVLLNCAAFRKTVQKMHAYRMLCFPTSAFLCFLVLSCIACTLLSLLLNCSSLLHKSSSLLSSHCPSRIPTCTSLAATITSRSDSVFSACAERTLLRWSASRWCFSSLAMFYRLQCPWGCCSLHFCALVPPSLNARQQRWNSGQMLSSLAHSSLEVHCSSRLKFFVAKNHLRSS